MNQAFRSQRVYVIRMETTWDDGNCAGACVSALPGARGPPSAAASSPASPHRQTEQSTARRQTRLLHSWSNKQPRFQRAGRTPVVIAPSTFLFLNALAWICCYQLVILVAKQRPAEKTDISEAGGGISLKIWSLKIVFCYPSKTWLLRNRLLWKNVNFLWCICT